jgi:hypothetical protein
LLPSVSPDLQSLRAVDDEVARSALHAGQTAWAEAAKLRGELQVLDVSGGRRRVRRFGGAAVLGVDAQGLFELVFEDVVAAHTLLRVCLSHQ